MRYFKKFLVHPLLSIRANIKTFVPWSKTNWEIEKPVLQNVAKFRDYELTLNEQQCLIFNLPDTQTQIWGHVHVIFRLHFGISSQEGSLKDRMLITVPAQLNLYMWTNTNTYTYSHGEFNIKKDMAEPALLCWAGLVPYKGK